MSLILEALNRSSRDRDVEEHARLHSQTYAERSEVPRSTLAWLPWFALLLALLAIVWLLFDRFTGDAVPDTPIHVLPEKQAPVETAAVVNLKPPVAAVQLPMPAASLGPNGVSVEYTGSADIVESAAADPAVAALYARTNAQPVIRREPALEIITQSPPKEVPIDLEEVLARTQEALKTASLPEHSAPFLSALSQQVKDVVPTMLYSAHDYSSRPGQSSVIINGKSLGQGGSIAGGVKLDEILPGSIVLSYQGTQFRLRALNSWVNL